MFRLVAVVLMSAVIGCSDPSIPTPNSSARRTVYHDVIGGTTRLTDEFAKECELILSSPGKPIDEIGKPRGKPHGDIMLPNRKSYDLYGNFVVCDGQYWMSPIFEQFSKSIKNDGVMGSITFKPQENYQAEFSEPTLMSY